MTGVGVLSGLVSGAVRQAVSPGEPDLARLEAAFATHPVLRELAPELHVVATRTAQAAGRPRRSPTSESACAADRIERTQIRRRGMSGSA